MSNHYTSEPLYPRRTLEECTKAAVKAFKKLGKQPTYDAVREIAGGGSNTTIAKAINAASMALIKESKATASKEKPAEPLMPEPSKEVLAEAESNPKMHLVNDTQNQEVITEHSSSNQEGNPKNMGSPEELAAISASFRLDSSVQLSNSPPHIILGRVRELEKLLELEMTARMKTLAMLATADSWVKHLEKEITEKDKTIEKYKRKLKKKTRKTKSLECKAK